MTFGKPTVESVAADREWRRKAAVKYQETQQRKPLRAESPKRARENRRYRKDRIDYLTDTPCAALHLDIATVVCRGLADTVQHLRGRRGKALLDQSEWSPLCWPHHSWAELHPTEAKALGLAKSKVGAA